MYLYSIYIYIHTFICTYIYICIYILTYVQAKCNELEIPYEPTADAGGEGVGVGGGGEVAGGREGVRFRRRASSDKGPAGKR
jgi:hypothetical protein